MTCLALSKTVCCLVARACNYEGKQHEGGGVQEEGALDPEGARHGDAGGIFDGEPLLLHARVAQHQHLPPAPHPASAPR
eukprot:1700976-Rhodomonas_salina.1